VAGVPESGGHLRDGCDGSFRAVFNSGELPGDGAPDGLVCPLCGAHRPVESAGAGR
jgi:hypothetical protein